MSQTLNPIPNKKVMINLVILYRLGKELFEQCDIKSLEFVTKNWFPQGLIKLPVCLCADIRWHDKICQCIISGLDWV